MKSALARAIYWSKTGNTEKVAFAIKEGLEKAGVNARTTPVTGKQTACFSSCMRDAKKTLATMQEILNKKGYLIVNCYSCYGEMASLVKRGHPTG